MQQNTDLPEQDQPLETGPAATDAAPAEPIAASEPDASHEAQLRELEQKAAENHEAFLRARAETENVRRRAQEDIAKASKFAIERFATELLLVKDSLEQTLSVEGVTPEALREGVDLTLKNLLKAFDKSGIEEINPLGDKFDPHKHQAISSIPSEQPANTVAQVFQKGYLLEGRVLRPALVAVSSGPAPAGGTT